MKVAIVYASKHESTHEVAEAIAGEIRSWRHDVEVNDVDGLDDLPDADAFVIGSAIYGGRWLKPARELIDTNAEELRGHPVWLFSVGPIGDDAEQAETGLGATALVEACGARGHALFAGKLDPSELGFAERLMVRAVKAPAGDYRDWDAIRRWARSVETSISLTEDSAKAPRSRAGVR